MGTLLVIAWIVAFASFIWLVVQAFSINSKWGVCVLLLSPIASILFAVKHWEKAKKPFILYLGSSFAAGVIFFSILTSMAGDTPSGNGVTVTNGGQQVTLSDEDRAKLNILEKTIGLAEKFAKTEKDHQIITAMKGYVGYAKNGGTAEQRGEVIRNISIVLERSDLKDSERKSLRDMLQKVKATKGNVEPNPPVRTTAVPVTVPSDSDTDAPARDLDDRKEPAPKAVEVAYTPKAAETISPAQTGKSKESPSETPGWREISPLLARKYLGSTVRVVGKSGNEQICFLAGVSGDVLEFENRSDMGTIGFSYKRSEIRSLKVYR